MSAVGFAEYLRRPKHFRVVGRARRSGRTVRVLHAAQRGFCGICGRELALDEASADHVFPRHYGYYNVGNLIAAHYHCNSGKGAGRPSGCSLVWLQVANTAIGIGPYGPTYFPRSATQSEGTGS